MTKYIHIICLDGKLYPTKITGQKKDKTNLNEKGNPTNKRITLAEADDLEYPVPSHNVGNIIRKMGGFIPIPYNIKSETRKTIMEPIIKRWRKEPLSLAIDEISSKSFIKYITPQVVPALERFCGSKEDKIDPNLGGKTFFTILDENGAETVIEYSAMLDWNIFKRRFGKNKGALKLFFDFFSKYVKGFSYNGSFKETIYELSKSWNTVEYKNDVSALLANLRKCGVRTLNKLEQLLDYHWRVLNNDEFTGSKTKLGDIHFHDNNQVSRIFCLRTEPTEIYTINAELIVPFNMDDENQARLYQSIIEGNGMSSFLGDGCAYLIDCDKKTNKISIENDGFQKISEPYHLQVGKIQKDT